MFEELLEDIAQKNGLREVNTYLKLTVGLGAILLCLLSTSYIPPLFIALLLTGAILILARVDAKTYAELFVVPLWFAIMSVAGIILISGGQDVFWSWDLLPSFSLSITRESINQGMFVFCRVIGGMSAMIFIALTAPMTDIFIVFRQCRIPEVVIDLMMIIYRYHIHPDGPGHPDIPCTAHAPWIFHVARIHPFLCVNERSCIHCQLGCRRRSDPGYGRTLL